MKKFLSLLLSVVMLLAAFPFAGFVSAKADYDYITLGSYPQTEVTDNTIIATLNDDASDWISYGYYVGTGVYADGQMTAQDYMRYKDVSLDGEKYRGVTFDHYRPYYSGLEETCEVSRQGNNGYTPGNVYWFKFEPLIWRVLDADSGLVMCENIIDSQPYNNFLLMCDLTDAYGYWGNAEMTYLASNWENSSLRKWLNEDFYDTAFSYEDKTHIKLSTIPNTIYDEDYSFPDTTENVFLLSTDDMVNTAYGFSSSLEETDIARVTVGTDYAECQGLYVSANILDYGKADWRLRSSVNNIFLHVTELITGEGVANVGGNTDSTIFGIRPALYFNPQSEIPQAYIPGQEVCEHSATKTDSIDPTCESAGYKNVTICEACLKVVAYGDEIPALGHLWNNGVITTEASCTANGEMTYTCTRDNCGQTKTESIAVAAHIDEDGDGICDICENDLGSEPADPVATCSHICHKTDGFSKFFYKIVRFFWKLFGTNKYCECGMAHY